MATATLPNPAEIDGANAPQTEAEQNGASQPYGVRNIDMPETLVNALKGLAVTFQAQEQFDRRQEVLQDRKHRFYRDGYQYIFEDPRTGYFQVGASGSTFNYGNNTNYVCPPRLKVYNIFQPALRAITAVLSQTPASSDFVPNSVDRPEDVDAADQAEKYRAIFKRHNSWKQQQQEAVNMMGVSGRTVLWTRTEADEQKFGINKRTGKPNQREIRTIHGTLETKCTIYARELKDCPYFFIFDDPNINNARAQYPEIADKLQTGMAGIGENNYERFARLGVLQGSRSEAKIGEALSHLVTRTHLWLRPQAWADKSLDTQFEGGTCRDKFKELFPQGAHVVFVGDVFAGAWEECLDDHIAVKWPYPGDGMSKMPFMKPAVPIQDDFNNDNRMYRDVKEYGWPSRWFKAETEDLDAIISQRAEPYAYREAKGVPQSTAVESLFYQEPDPEIPPTLFQHTQWMQGDLLQFILAIVPAILGASMDEAGKTASGYAQARATALGQLGIIWGNIVDLFAESDRQAALCAAVNPDYLDDEPTVESEDGVTKLSVADIAKGSFHAHVDDDSSFPESTSAKRSQVGQLVTMAVQTPVGAQIFQSPKNWATINSYMGVPELEFPQIEAYEKQEREIDLLLQQAPIPPGPEELAAAGQQAQIQHAAAAMAAKAQGLPEPPPPPPPDPSAMLKSSVPVGLFDFHPFEIESCRDYLSSAAAYKQKTAGNAQGLLNIELHIKEHLQAAQALAQLMAPMAPPMPPPAAAKPATHAHPPAAKAGLPPPGGGGPTV